MRGFALLCALMLSGCFAHLGGTRFRSRVSTEAGQFAFEYEGGDRAARAKVEEAIRAASPKLASWGGLREPVNVFILPDHLALESSVNRWGYGWLRAWARYDEIYLQSPRTWSVFGASQGDVNELLLHELTHTVMYQQAADRTHWARKGIPLWFREGMASWTANQGYRWPSLEDLARFYEEHPGRDPVGDPDPLYQNESSIVYGAAHHAFSFLVNRYGTEKVRELLGQMRGGLDFREAFAAAMGVELPAFVKDFKRYVRLRGFRGGRLRLLHRATPPAPVPAPAVPHVAPDAPPAAPPATPPGTAAPNAVR